jgi:hypothetical protein
VSVTIGCGVVVTDIVGIARWVLLHQYIVIRLKVRERVSTIAVRRRCCDNRSVGILQLNSNTRQRLVLIVGDCTGNRAVVTVDEVIAGIILTFLKSYLDLVIRNGRIVIRIAIRTVVAITDVVGITGRICLLDDVVARINAVEGVLASAD